MRTVRATMSPQRQKVVLLALLPAALAPLAMLFTQAHDAPILLGFSGHFWAGAIIGVSLMVLTVAAYQFKRLAA